MRKDISKVVVERPRRSQKFAYCIKYKARANLGNCQDLDKLDEMPVIEGNLKKKFGYMTKDFSDFLTPLKGFLKKNVGRRWDSLYSDICQFLNKSSVTHKHIFDHLMYYVCVKPHFVDGIYYEDAKMKDEISGDSYFVDIHGILRYKKNVIKEKVDDDSNVLKPFGPSRYRKEPYYSSKHFSLMEIEFKPDAKYVAPNGTVYLFKNDLWWIVIDPGETKLYTDKVRHPIFMRERHMDGRDIPFKFETRTMIVKHLKVKQASKKDKKLYGLIP
jgi:hypothetical protein